MRCEHMVEKKRGFIPAGWKCGHRLKSVSKKLAGVLTWHIYRCRNGHETRFYIRR